MALSPRQAATAMMQIQHVSMNAVHEGEEAVVVAIAEAAAEKLPKRGRPPSVPEEAPVVTRWMIKNAGSVALSGGVLTFRAGQIIDDVCLHYDLVQAEFAMIPMPPKD